MLDTLCNHSYAVIPTLLTATTVSGGLSLWWIRRYIQDQDMWRNKISDRLEKALSSHDECQKVLPEKFIGKTDFREFIDLRTREHALINNRLLALENQQAALFAKIDVFMDDIKTKQDRLSATFVAREATISERIDRLVESHNSK